MKQFRKFLAEMDDQQQTGGMPPVNGGVKPSVPPEVATELNDIAQKLNQLLKKLGIDQGEGEGGEQGMQPPEKGLGDKMGDKNTSTPPGPPPNFQ